MKRKFLLYIIINIIICVGCSSDEIETLNLDTNYVEYLMLKCDEFAEKYKIPIKLDKEKLQNVASQISVEDLECQFAMASELFDNQKVIIRCHKNKMRIKRKLGLSESQYPFRNSVSYTNTFKFNSPRHEYNKEVTILISWAYNEEKLGWIEGLYQVGDESQNAFPLHNVTFSVSENNYTLRAYTRTTLIWDVVYSLEVDIIAGHNNDGDYIIVNTVPFL